MKKLLCSLALTLVAALAGAATYLIEFENFNVDAPATIGNDNQISGGKFVTFRAKKLEISGDFELPESGRYYTWVRNKTAGEKYRFATGFANDTKLGKFGDTLMPNQKKGNQIWAWERSPFPKKLDAGKIHFRFVSNSEFTRYDAMILTTDANFVPDAVPTGLPTLKKIAGEADKVRMPAAVGTGPDFLVFAGGRPWVADWFVGNLQKSGARTTKISARYLNGLSGASTAQHAVDKVQPEPYDGITPAFAKLDQYKLVVFHFFTEKNLRQLLTPERVKMLRNYVENGGNILWVMTSLDIPEIQPAQVGNVFEIDDACFATRPAGENFQTLPEKIPVYRVFRILTPAPDAKIESMIKDAEGNDLTPLIVSRQIGKGKVTYVNAQLMNPKQIKEFSNWAYANAFFAAAAGNAADVKLDPAKLVSRLAPLPPVKTLDEVKVSVELPKNELVPVTGCQIDDNTATFANGSKLVVDASGLPSFYLPGKDQPFIAYKKIPALQISGERKFDSATAEAVDVKEANKQLDIKWNYRGMTANAGVVTLHFEAENAAFDWHFTAGKFTLDGRIFDSLAEKIDLLKAPGLISSIRFESALTPEKPLFARRYACYNAPRGYADVDMTGKTAAGTQLWDAFGSGQPFLYIAGENSLVIGHNTEPIATGLELKRAKGAAAITATHRSSFGRLPAPQSTDWFYWHNSEGKERGHNDYLAIYQYQRQTLRRAAGLDELPAYPVAEISYKISEAERDQVLKLAAEYGYRYAMTQNPESPLERIAGRVKNSRRIASFGMKSYEWSAGSYIQGKDGWIYTQHPEWMCKGADGKVNSYFAGGGVGYPVIDVNNADFQAWFFEQMKPLFAAGMGWLYRDMDGTAVGTTNLSLPQSPNGMRSQIKIYRFLHDHGCRVGIEGINPLVIDQFWFHGDRYAPIQGNEFSMIGMAPWCDLTGVLGVDPFIFSMYGCFPRFETEGGFLGIERIDGELERAKKVFELVKPFNAALDATGMPWIRETEFGTTWISEKGGALCFREKVKKATVELPAGYRIRGVDGNTLTDIPAGSVYILEKESK